MLSDPHSRPLVFQVLRVEDAGLWVTVAVWGAVAWSHFTWTFAGIDRFAAEFGSGMLVGMVVTGGFRGARLLRDASDRRAIAQQQQEIRDEALRRDGSNAAGGDVPD